MDRKEYDAMMEERRKKMKTVDDNDAGAATVEGEMDEEVVDELDHHEYEQHSSNDDEGVSTDVVVKPKKKPLNGYMRYVAQIREAVTTEFPELTGKELVRLLDFVCIPFLSLILFLMLKLMSLHEFDATFFSFSAVC